MSETYKIDNEIGGGQVDDPYIRYAAGRFGQLSLVGHCLASDAEIATAAEQATVLNNILPLTELAGSYSGVWTTEQATTVFADLAGQFPLYFRQTDAGISISRSSRQLASKSADDIDRTTLAARICFGMESLSQGHSLFNGVSCLQGGESLRIDTRGAVLGSYETFAADPAIDFSTAAEMTRHSLTGAIQRRLDTRQITSDFSGGHDSTSLAMLAASLGKQPLPSMMIFNPAYPAGDLVHARRLAALHPGVALEEIEEGPMELPYSKLLPQEAPFFADEPYRNVKILGRELRVLRAVHESGSSLHMVGLGGDALYDGSLSIADLLEQGETERARQYAHILARLSLGTPQDLLDAAQRLQKVHLSQAYELLAEVCRDPEKLPAFSAGWLERPSANLRWLTPAIRQQLAERAHALSQTATTVRTRSECRSLANIYTNGVSQVHVHHLRGLRHHAPFLDHNVIRAATSLNIFDRLPAGTFKPLLKAALAGHGVVPEVFERTSKGNYSPVSDGGFRQALPRILGLLSDSRLAALGIIDPHAVQQSIEQHGLKGGRDFYIEAFIGPELWLRQRELLDSSAKELLAPAAYNPRNSAHEIAASNEVLQRRYMLAPDMAFASGPIQMAALNLRTGDLVTLNQTAVRILQAVNEHGEGTAAVQSLAAQFPDVALGRLRADAAATLEALKAQALIAEQPIDQPTISPHLFPEWPGPDLRLPEDTEFFRVLPLHPTEELALSEAEVATVRQALLAAHTLSRQGLPASIAHLEDVRRQAKQPPDSDAVKRDMVILRQLALDSQHNDQRIACYESSLATAILAAERGQRVSWTIGVAFRPGPQLHAWVEADGKPLLISTDQPVEGAYQTLLRV